MDEETLKYYGFNASQGQDCLNLFLAIPIYPETITKKQLRDKLNCSGVKINSLVAHLPPNAPVMEDGTILSRLK